MFLSRRAVGSSANRSTPASVQSRVRLLLRDRANLRTVPFLLLHSSGFLIRGCKSSLWVHGETPAQFDAARRLIHQAMQDRPHVGLVLTSACPATVEYLRASFPDDLAYPLPWNLGPALRRFLACVKPGMLLLLDGGRTLGHRALDAMTAKGIPVAAVNIGRAESIARYLLTAALSDSALVSLCVQDRECADALQTAGVPPEKIFATGSLDLEPGRQSQLVSHATLRDLLGITGDGPIIIGADIAEAEEALVIETFAKIRETHPGARLILEPSYRRRSASLLNEIRRKGWLGYIRNGRTARPPAESWDVLVEAIPGELLAFRPLAFATVLGGNGVVAQGETTAGYSHQKPIADGASARTLASIQWKLPQSPALPRVRQAWRVPSLRDRVGSSHAWKSAAGILTKRRIDDWPSLRERLGQPRSVLCLGNGPSSEDPRLEQMAHDCLMRVNWRWINRAFLTRPQVVFVGDAATIHKVPACIFGFWNTSIEYALLLRYLVTHGFRRMEYVTMERLSPLAAPDAWCARPSNGALMVVAACALQPERLIIGGMDLFQHQDGRYPGDLRSRNEYCRAHSRDTDVAIIEAALKGYHGEVVILSDILRDSLAMHRELSHHGA